MAKSNNGITFKSKDLDINIALPIERDYASTDKFKNKLNKSLMKEINKKAGKPVAEYIEKVVDKIEAYSVSREVKQTTKKADLFTRHIFKKIEEDIELNVTALNKGELYLRVAVLIWRILAGTPIDEEYTYSWTERKTYKGHGVSRTIKGDFEKGITGHMTRKRTYEPVYIQRTVHHKPDNESLRADWRFQIGGQFKSVVLSEADFTGIDFNDHANESNFYKMKKIIQAKCNNKMFKSFLITSVSDPDKLKVLEYGGYERDNSEHGIHDGKDKLHGISSHYSVQAPFGIVRLAMLEWQAVSNQLSLKKNIDGMQDKLVSALDMMKFYSSYKNFDPRSTTKGNHNGANIKTFKNKRMELAVNFYKGEFSREMKKELFEHDLFMSEKTSLSVPLKRIHRRKGFSRLDGLEYVLKNDKKNRAQDNSKKNKSKKNIKKKRKPQITAAERNDMNSLLFLKNSLGLESTEDVEYWIEFVDMKGNVDSYEDLDEEGYLTPEEQKALEVIQKKERALYSLGFRLYPPQKQKEIIEDIKYGDGKIAMQFLNEVDNLGLEGLKEKKKMKIHIEENPVEWKGKVINMPKDYEYFDEMSEAKGHLYALTEKKGVAKSDQVIVYNPVKNIWINEDGKEVKS